MRRVFWSLLIYYAVDSSVAQLKFRFTKLLFPKLWHAGNLGSSTKAFIQSFSPFRDLEKILMLEALEGGRKIPLKLRRWGDLGGESWWQGKMVLGELGDVRERRGAVMGLEGWGSGDLREKPLDVFDKMGSSPWMDKKEILFIKQKPNIYHQQSSWGIIK